MRFNIIILVIGTFFAAIGVAQEVRYVDLSGIDQPTSDEPYGSRVENFSCGGSKELFPHRAKVSLEWIEATDIYPRKQFGMEVRVENVGSARSIGHWRSARRAKREIKVELVKPFKAGSFENRAPTHEHRIRQDIY